MPSSGCYITWKILNILVAPWGFTTPTSTPKMLLQLTRIIHDEHTSVLFAKRYKKYILYHMNSLGGRIELYLRGKYGVLQSNTLFKGDPEVWSLRDVVSSILEHL